MSPPEYANSLVTLIEDLDKPGRQVLLKAVIAEISLEDATALGLRWSNSTISPTNQDNAISIGANTAGRTAGGVITGTKNNLLPGLFDTSVLNVGVDLNVLFQALSQKTGINILSEPRIFTSDNQEAEFFNGQDIPFVTDTQTTDTGALTQSFDYRAVGINLRVRPRITVRRDVDLNINLELSSIQPNQTLFGGYIVDRRETTTHLILKDGQTVVISGILRSEDSDVKRKVPLLGDIPLIGLAFQSTEKTKTNSEIVAFITPIVIENDDEAAAAAKPDVDRLDELRDQMLPEQLKTKPAQAPEPVKQPYEPSRGMGTR
jgi:general secretion pathway protein D